MTRIFTDGAEMRDMLFWSIYTPGHVLIKSSSPDPYDGEYYYHIDAAGQVNKQFAPITECYFRARIYFPGAPITPSYNYFPHFYGGAYPLAYLTADTSGHWTVNRGYDGGLLEDSGVLISTNQWYLVEAHFKLANAPNGVFEVKIDGVQIIDFHGDTLYDESKTTIDEIIMLARNAIYIDDLALNDTAGGVDDTWCGDGSIVKIYPDGNGSHNNWHGSDGNDVNNYLLVQEFPADNDTTYVSHDSSVSGVQDQYAMSDYDGTGKTITRVYAEVRARITAASANTLKVGILPSGSTDQMSAGVTLGVGAYMRVVGDDYLENPADTNPWEEADIDALEGVIEVG